MSRFLDEVRRRKVGRVIVAYAVTAFVVLQVADIVLPAIGAPDWVLGALVVIIALGFPLAVGLAWAFDITADGIARTPDVHTPAAGESAASSAGPRPKAVLLEARGVLLVSAVALVSLSAGVWYVWPFSGSDSSLDPDLVAIMPFRVSGDASLAELREGMVDLLATTLAGDAGLRPADPGTVLSSWRRIARSDDADLPLDSARLVARAVGAGRLLQGSVVAAAGELVITASLTPVSGAGRVLPASARGRPDELHRMVDDMTTQLLSLEAGEMEQRLAALTSTSLPAIRAYLAGRAAYRRSRFQDALVAFDRAVAIDSTFALAALNLNLTSGWGNSPTPNAPRAARLAWQHRDRLTANDRFLLEGRLGTMYPTARTVAQRIGDWDRALSHLPDRADALFMYGDLLLHEGALADIEGHEAMALQAFNRALALDSSFTPALTHLLDDAIFVRDTVSARRLFHLLERADTSAASAPYQYWARAVLLGDPSQAAALRTAVDTMSLTDLDYIQLNFVFGMASSEDAERATAAELRRALTSQERSTALRHAYEQALVMGRPAEALRHAEAAQRLTDSDEIDWHTRLVVDGLFWDGDTLAASRSAGLLEALLRNEPRVSASRAHREAVCAVGQWRAWHDDAPAARALAQQLDPVSANSSDDVRLFDSACSLVINSILALGSDPDRSRLLLQRADSLAGLGPSSSAGALRALNFSIARLNELFGSPALALRAVRRHVVLPAARLQLSTRYREEGRLAELIGDHEAAVTAYTWYLMLRPAPEPALASQVDGVRTALAGLTQERVRH